MKRLIWVAGLFLLMNGAAAAQQPDTPVVSPALLAFIDDLEARVQDIRQLEAVTPVIRRFPTRQEAIAFILALYEEELTDAIVFENTQFYRAFDFVSSDFDLKATFLALQTDQVAGFYYPDAQEMNTILFSGGKLGDTLPALEQFIYAHEFTHALQDQHFGLSSYLDSIEDSDPALAALALVEGDAMLVSQEYMTWLISQQPLAALALLTYSIIGDVDLPEGIPPILENELLMPYLDGMGFVMALRNAGGWALVNAAYDNPPRSTEQILHPEKYRDGEAPVEVTLQPVDVILGDGWTLVTEQPMGEFYLGQYLATQLPERNAQAAAAGWGGDRFSLHYNPNADEHAWVMRIAWDTPDDAAEFADAYQSFAARRMGRDATASESGSCWIDGTTQAALCFTESGGETLLAFAPEIDLARQLLAAQG